MKAILNHDIIDLKNLNLTISNRGFRYGDGLFETIAIVNGKPRLLKNHLLRMQNGASLLKIDCPGLFDFNKTLQQLEKLISYNKITADGIIRIHLWRDSEGLYTPSTNLGSCLITIQEVLFEDIIINVNASFSRDIFNVASKFSAIKSMSALNYVMAGIEKKERRLDEIIILDKDGFVSEALSSNIFWGKENTYFTPSLDTGCIEGVMRNWLISKFRERHYNVVECKSGIDNFLDAESIFTTNASGIGHIQSIDGYKFEMDDMALKLMKSIS